MQSVRLSKFVSAQQSGTFVAWWIWQAGRWAKGKNMIRKKTRKRGALSRKAEKAAGLTAGEWFEKLAGVQARLRAPDGCPWDREQTHASLRTYLIEEAYEVLEALESGDDAKFAEEMGDLLLQIVFHSQIAKEEGRFSVSDVIREVHDKMVRRHPHVFGEKHAKNTAEVLKKWEQIKKEERAAAGKKNGDGLKQDRKAKPAFGWRVAGFACRPGRISAYAASSADWI